jgi:peptide/nickel transport system substrate-binding protein
MKKSVKRTLVIVLALVIVASFAACSGGTNPPAEPANTDPAAEDPASPAPDDSAAEPAAPAKDTLVIATTEDNGTLDPTYVTGTSYMQAARTYMDVLFEYKPDGSISWGLATSMDEVSDIQYTLHLREGVTFSNGNPFTADDVLFSLGIMEGDPRLVLNVKAIDFEKTKKIDDYTVDLWLTHYDVTQFPGMYLIYMLDAESYDAAEMAVKPIGTGPYVVTEYVVNSHLYVEARDGYWGEPPAIKKIHFEVMNEDSQRVNAVETGEVDMATIPLKDAEYVESLGTYNVESTPSIATVTMYLNCSSTGTPLNSVEAREAVMHAVDRQAVKDLVYSGRGTVPTWPVSEHCVDFETRLSNMDETYSVGYDPAKARELAEKSGLVGQKLRITTNGSQEYITSAEIIQNSLQEIGVESEIINYDQATYMTIVADPSNFDIAVYVTGAGTGLGVDIFAMYPTFFPLGWTGENHDKYMELGQKACGTIDEKARADMLYEMLEMFYVDQPWYAVTEMSLAIAFSKNVTGIEYYVINYVRFNEWSFVK